MTNNDGPPSVRVTGKVLRGKYRVERVLGSGGMGIVVLARHLKLDQNVAIKMLHSEARTRPGVVTRFAREARAAARLKSEHVVRIFDVDEDDDGTPFFVMEHLAGRDLEQVSEEDGPLAVERAVDFVLQACEAVAEAHSLGMVHRDLKPANLFLVRRRDGSSLVKLLDFGISKADEGSVEDVSLTSPASVIGSPLYMSPEQLKSSKDVDGRTDIWALGVVLFQLLTRATPFDGDNSSALAAKIASEPPRSLRALRGDLPDALVSAVERCLTKDVELRFQDAIELARAIAPFAPGGLLTLESRVAGVARAAAVDDAALGATMPEPEPSDPAREAASLPGSAEQAPRVTEAITATPQKVSLAKTTGSPSAKSVPPQPQRAEMVASGSESPRPRRRAAALAILAVAAVSAVVAIRSRSTDPAAALEATSSSSARLAPPVAPTAAGADAAPSPSTSSAPSASAAVMTAASAPTPPPTSPLAAAHAKPLVANPPRTAPVASSPAPPPAASSAPRDPLQIEIK